MAKLKVGDRCKLKGNDYLDLQVHKILDRGAHGRSCVLVECLVSAGTSPPNFSDFSVIRTHRMVDLIPLKVSGKQL